MRASSLLYSLLLAACTASAEAQATSPARVPSPALAAQPAGYAAAITTDREFILDTMRVLGAPGASVTVIKDGEVVWMLHRHQIEGRHPQQIAELFAKAFEQHC